MDDMLVFLEGGERDVHAELDRAEWHAERAPERHRLFLHRMMGTRWGRRAWRVAALRDRRGRVVAGCSLYDLRWRLDARRLRLAGLGSVVVRPEFRRLGLGTQLLRSIEARLEREGYAGTVLFSVIGAAYYRRLGYEELPQRAIETDLLGHPTAPAGEPPTAVRPFEEADFAAVREIYNRSSSLQRFAPLRDEAYWRHQLERARLADELFPEGPVRHALLVSERRDGDADVVAAYLWARLERARRRMSILEYGCDPGARAHLPALLRDAGRRLGAAPGLRVRGPVPSRFENLCPGRVVRWVHEREARLMVRSFGGFVAPSDADADERLVWASDRF